MDSNRGFKEIINSPFVLVAFVLIMWPVVSGISEMVSVRLMAKQIRQEVNAFVSDKGEDNLKEISSNIVGQISEGIREGFSSSGGESEAAKYKTFSEIKSSIEFTDVKKVFSPFNTNEKFIGQITNKSSKAIRGIHLAVSYYDKNDQLIDVGNEWLSNLPYLEAGERAPFSFSRSIGSHNDKQETINDRRSERINVQISQFYFIENDQGQKEDK